MTTEEILNRRKEIAKEIQKKEKEIEALEKEEDELQTGDTKVLYDEMIAKNPEMWWKKVSVFSDTEACTDYYHIVGVKKANVQCLITGEISSTYDIDKRISFNDAPYLKVTVDFEKTYFNIKNKELFPATKEEIAYLMKDYHEKQLKEIM